MKSKYFSDSDDSRNREREQKLKALEADMRQVFDQKSTEKDQHCREKEAEVFYSFAKIAKFRLTDSVPNKNLIKHT